MAASRTGAPTRPTVKTESWYTRNQALELLRCSERKLGEWEKSGLLHPIYEARKVKGGQMRAVRLYDPQELTRLPLRRRGKDLSPEDRAPQAFEMFSDGHRPADVVIATRLDPDRVRELHEMWLQMGGSDLVIAPAAKRDLEAVVGAFADIAELVARVRERVPPLPPPPPPADTTDGETMQCCARFSFGDGTHEPDCAVQLADRTCGSQGIDDDGHCKRCGLVPAGEGLECPPGFFESGKPYNR